MRAYPVFSLTIFDFGQLCKPNDYQYDIYGALPWRGRIFIRWDFLTDEQWINFTSDLEYS
jgi:hypothetical protein